MRRIPVVIFSLALAVVAGACDLFPSEDDELYVSAFCQATTGFSNSIEQAETEGDIVAALREYQDALRGIQPPDDAAGFHNELIAYLGEVAENPQQPIDRRPPAPPSDVKRRLENAASVEDQCDGERFFGSG